MRTDIKNDVVNKFLYKLKFFSITAIVLFAQIASVSDSRAQDRIIWDEWDVPHIQTNSVEGLYYGFGWAQMEAHAEKILRLYGQARGKATLYWGENNREKDEQVLKIGIPEHAAHWLQKQSVKNQKMLGAFVWGINDYCKKNADKIDPSLKKVLPILPTDPIALLLVSYHLGVVGFNLQQQTASWNNAGSNAWALSANKLEQGPAMLVIQPHPPWTDNYRFFEAQLKCGSLNIYGVSLLGIPAIAMGFNDHLGWGMTFNQADGLDLVEVTIKDNLYSIGNEWQPYTVRKSILYRENNKADTLFVKETAFGPIIQEKDNIGLAIRISGLDRTDFFEQFDKMAMSKNLKDFESALSMLQLPVQNIVYADKHGDIFYLYNGYVPVRKIDEYAHWQKIQKSSDPNTLVTKYHSYEELPKYKNPNAGFIMNSNNPPWNTTFPAVLDAKKFPKYIAPEFFDLRSQRSLRMLLSKPKFSFTDVESMQQSTYCELADKTIPDIESYFAGSSDANIKQAISILKSWDRTTFKTSIGSVLFTNWVFKCARISIFKEAWDSEKLLETPRFVTENALNQFEGAVQDMIRKYGKLDISWGEVYEIQSQGYKVPSSVGLNETGSFSASFYSRSGNKFLLQGGVSFTSVVAFGQKIKAMGLLGYGNISSDLFSQHHTDKQLQLLSDGKLRSIYFYDDEINIHAVKVTDLSKPETKFPVK